MTVFPESRATDVVSARLVYAYPIAVTLSWLATLTFTWCTLKAPKTSPKIARMRVLVASLLAVLFLSYTAQTILYISRALIERGWWPAQHWVVGVLSSMLVWGGVLLQILSSPSLVWHPYLAMFLVGLGFEAALCKVSQSVPDKSPVYANIRFSLEILRIVCLALLVITGCLLLAAPSESSKAFDEERQSLLGSQENGTPATPENSQQYGTVKSSEETDDEESEEDKKVREQQRKRLEEEGGWWGYIKGFAIFLPYLWPSRNRKVQACIFVLCLQLMLERLLNVLEPRQIGLLTDALGRESGKGVFPWNEFIGFVLLYWLNGSAGITLINDLAKIPIQNFSRARISDLAFSHVMNLSMDFHNNKDSGEVLKSLDQAQVLNDLLDLVLFDLGPVFLDLIIAIFYVTYLFDTYVTLVFVIAGISFFWTVTKLTQWLQPKRRVYKEKDRLENQTIYASVSNWQTVTYFNRAQYERKRYGDSVEASIHATATYSMANAFTWAGQFFVLMLGISAASFVAVYQITYYGKPAGNFVTLLFYWRNLVYPLHRVASSFKDISSVLIDAERLLQLLRTKPSVQDAPDATELEVTEGKVEFDNVDFSYDGRKQTLKKINFTANPGQTIAFVGETGGGKSTTLNLLFRFYDVIEGSIKIDGQDIRHVTLESLRDALGAVPQDPSLFNQTIMENVRYARLDATDEEIQEACKAAAVHDKIMSFPDQYKTKVGERGVKLSGGELQRVAIARVILKNPKIVMLDEATSAVDSSTEEQIQAAFEKLSAGRTTFVIAHRLSTVMDADLILVVDHGEIIERGTHDALLRKGGKYYELWTKQTEGKRSKASSIMASGKEQDLILLNDLPADTYQSELAKSFGVKVDAPEESDGERADGPSETS